MRGPASPQSLTLIRAHHVHGQSAGNPVEASPGRQCGKLASKRQISLSESDQRKFWVQRWLEGSFLNVKHSGFAAHIDSLSIQYQVTIAQ
jgi:hypothetical protein